jgi:hypothetical protein
MHTFWSDTDVTTTTPSGGYLEFIEFFSPFPGVADILSTAVAFFATVLLAVQGIRRKAANNTLSNIFFLKVFSQCSFASFEQLLSI